MLDHNFWGSRSLSGIFASFAPPGPVPVVAPRYHGPLGVSPQKRRAAHGPRHPALNGSLGVVFGIDWLGVGLFRGVRCWFFCVVFSSLGSESCLVWCPSRPGPCLYCCSCPSLSLSLSLDFCLVCSPTPFLSLFLFLSLRCWGNASPFAVCVSPSVFSSRPRSCTSTRTISSTPTPRSPPSPVFFWGFFTPSMSFVFPVVEGLGPSWCAPPTSSRNLLK